MRRTLLAAIGLAGASMPDPMQSQEATPSPERMALATKLLDAMKYDSVAIVDLPSPSPLSSANRGAMAALKEFREKYLTLEQMKRIDATEYAKKFGGDELRQLISFYESPLGSKFRIAQLDLGPALRSAIAAAYASHQAEFQQILSKTW